MLTRLTPWRTTLLFIPFIISFVLSLITNNTVQDFNDTYQISSILSTFNILLLISCQTYLLLKFNKIAVKKATFFTANAVIAVVPTMCWFIYGIYWTIITTNIHRFPAQINGPIHSADSQGYALIALFLLHMFATFFIINNQYVAWKIKRLADPSEQVVLIQDYLRPMKLIVRISIIVFGISMLIDILYDLTKLLY